MPLRTRAIPAVVLLAVCVIASTTADAHGVSSKDGRFLQSINGPAIVPLMYLGAKHMVTGYDHLLFLVGVVFFLYRTRDILFDRGGSAPGAGDPGDAGDAHSRRSLAPLSQCCFRRWRPEQS